MHSDTLLSAYLWLDSNAISYLLSSFALCSPLHNYHVLSVRVVELKSCLIRSLLFISLVLRLCVRSEERLTGGASEVMVVACMNPECRD